MYYVVYVDEEYDIGVRYCATYDDALDIFYRLVEIVESIDIFDRVGHSRLHEFDDFMEYRRKK